MPMAFLIAEPLGNKTTAFKGKPNSKYSARCFALSVASNFNRGGKTHEPQRANPVALRLMVRVRDCCVSEMVLLATSPRLLKFKVWWRYSPPLSECNWIGHRPQHNTFAASKYAIVIRVFTHIKRSATEQHAQTAPGTWPAAARPAHSSV